MYVVWQKLFPRRNYPHIYSQDRMPTTDHTTNRNQVQLGQPEFYLGYLQECRWGITYRNDSQIAAAPRPTPAWLTAHKTGNLEHTQSEGSSAAWKVSFPGACSNNSARPCFLLSTLQLNCQLLLITLAGRKGLVNESSQFRRLSTSSL